jgi:hypothetical protein
LKLCTRTSEYVFTYRGKRIRSIKVAWTNGAKAAGLSHILFHDLRRAGVQNLSRVVPEAVAMSISGHKTRAVFDRYNIVSEADKVEAMAKLEAAQSELEALAEAAAPSRTDRFPVPELDEAQARWSYRTSNPPLSFGRLFLSVSY